MTEPCDDDAPVDHLGVTIAAPATVVSAGIRRSLREGRYETREARALMRLLQPGDRVLELGAGLGFLSTVAAKIVGPGSVLCFEANPDLIDVIRTTHRLNDVAGIDVRNAIVSRTPDPAGTMFHIREEFWTSSQIEAGRRLRSVVVASTDFDAVLTEFAPSVLVCDIEGGELELLRGIATLRDIRKILLEIHTEVIGLAGVKAIFASLAALGFAYDQRVSAGAVLHFQWIG